jgi:SAM-dependent methyltransferase
VLVDLAAGAGLLAVLCFGFVLLFGAPFLPTLRPQIAAALDLLDLKPGDTLLELGCGDGRVLIAAAERGLHAVGYELNPIMAALAWLRTRPHRQRIRVVWGDYWRATWPPAEGIFGFILPRYMSKLHKKVMRYPHKPIRVASFAFAILDAKPANTKDGVFLYIYK